MTVSIDARRAKKIRN